MAPNGRTPGRRIIGGSLPRTYSKITSHLRYRFFARGAHVEIDHRAVIDGSRYIVLGHRVCVHWQAWLSVPLFDLEAVEPRPYLIIGDDTCVGPNCTISAASRIEICRSVLLGPHVLIVDHAHQYEDITRPISLQGVRSQGSIVIEDNCWLGAYCVVYSARRPLRIGRNSVIADRAVVRDHVPSYSKVAGNPAVLVSRYNHDTKKWVEAT